MSLAAGIVGLPNVGKSTLFNALLKKQAALAANYPFATIDPNTGVVPVPDDRLSQLARVVETTTIKPATVEFVDIAGLVKGASQGEGLGNQFLAHIREVDVICHVLREFSDESVLREGSVDPIADAQTITTELLLADLSTLDKQKEPKGVSDSKVQARWHIIKELRATVAQGQVASSGISDPDGQQVAKELGLLTAKPLLFVINVDEQQLQNNLELRQQYAEQLDCSPEDIVLVSAQIESEIAQLAEDEQELFLAELGLKQTGLERLIKAVYQKLGLQSFLTAGKKEVRAWTIPTGTKAAQAAGVIHTDFEKKFIKAQVASFADFMAYGSWKSLKEAGKARLEGRDYLMQPNDVVEFMIGA